MKVPLTARISPALHAKLTVMQETTGKDRTACLEAALHFFFTNCPDYSTAEPPVNQELVQALRDALRSPEIIQVIQTCITPVIQPCDTAGQPENQPNVSQERITENPPVSRPRITVSRQRITENEARELVQGVKEIQEREGCTIDQACGIAGISNKKYYNRVHFLDSL